MVSNSVRILALLAALAMPALAEAQQSEQVLTPTVRLDTASAPMRPSPRDNWLPRTAWENHPSGRLWTRAVLAALSAHGKPLLEIVPKDIADWCPSYPDNTARDRAAFWTGMISMLARFESTWRPRAVGGGGKWHGLTQILPATARGYGCRAQSGGALRNGPANLSCAVRIMAVTVARDNAVALSDGKRAGVGADWGPVSNPRLRARMQAYTKRQVYCRPLASVRPALRPR